MQPRFCLLSVSVWALTSSFLLTSPRVFARQADNALDKQITIERQSIYLGELLELLAEQTGAIFKAEGEKSVSGMRLCVRAKQLPAGRITELIRGVLSYRDAEWEWRKDESDRRVQYTLAQSTGAKALPSQIEAWIEDVFQKQLEAFKISRTTPPEEQAKLNDGSGILPTFPLHPITKGKADLLLDALTEEQRRRVIRGDEQVYLPLDKLPPSGRAFIDALNDQARKSSQSVPGSPPPDPIMAVQFRRMVYMASGMQHVQCEFWDKLGYQGSPVLGGKASDAFDSFLLQRWVRTGEATTHKLCERVVPSPAVPDDNREVPTVEARLLQMARALDITLIARLAYEKADPPGSTYGRRVSDVLGELSRRDACMAKWTDDALLISTRKWHLKEETSALTPYKLVKELRQREKDSGGTFSLSDLLFAASHLSPYQLQGLSSEWRSFIQVLRSHGIFALAGSSPLVAAQMQASRGYSIKHSERALLTQNPRMAHAVEGTVVSAIRIREIKEPNYLPAGAREILIDILDSAGQWKPGVSFAVLPRGAETSTRPDRPTDRDR